VVGLSCRLVQVLRDEVACRRAVVSHRDPAGTAAEPVQECPRQVTGKSILLRRGPHPRRRGVAQHQEADGSVAGMRAVPGLRGIRKPGDGAPIVARLGEKHGGERYRDEAAQPVHDHTLLLRWRPPARRYGETVSADAMSGGALAGIRVADFSRVLAGPFATMMLADLGADVIKIESPAGDDTRQWQPPTDASGGSTYFSSVNRNKRSLVCDLRTEEGRERALRLALAADVVVENFRPGTMHRFGL